MNEIVSAIITTYKRPPQIVERAAQSVLSQTYKNIELIIVDDSPSSYELRDSVRKMAASLSVRVRYFQHEKNKGACAARNTGIKHSKGEFIAFLDDDDEWLPEKIEKQLHVMNENEKAAIVYCGRYIYNVPKDIITEDKIKLHRGMVYKKLILENFIGSTSYPLIRKSAAEKIGGFDIEMKAAQDYEMWLRLAKEYEVDYVNEPLVRYYIHEGDQITKNHKNKAEALERLNELNMDYLKKHPKAHSTRILRVMPYYLKFDILKAKMLFWKALEIYPLPNINMARAFKKIFIDKKG